jgi:protein-arginine kinase activator protein McsA
MPDAWRYSPLTWATPLCQGCEAAAGTMAVYEGRTWRLTLCAACAAAHRSEHGEQLDLFGEEDTA